MVELFGNAPASKIISCPYCYNKLTKSQKDRFSMRQKQILIARKFNKAHLYQKEY